MRFDNLVTPQDVPTATTVNTNTGLYRSMAKYKKGKVVITAHLSDGKTAIAQLTCSTAATATSKADVSGKTVTLTGSTAVPEQVGVINFDVGDLDLANGKIFVGVDITTNQNGDDVGAVLVREQDRYEDSYQDSVV